jgi:glycosyltransferase involved in cell wall biosynthesis
MEYRKINIVTINLNNKDGLEKTINSVINQTYFNRINYIIIDGGSTDGSIDVIDKYREYLSYYVSEKDNGIFNAMNKGVDACNGEYVLFLNSGDNFHGNDVIEKMYDELTEDVVYGDMLVHTSLDKFMISEYDFFNRWFIPHPSTFTRVELLKRKRLDESYKIISDWIYYYEYIHVNKLPHKHIDLVVTDFYVGGASSNFKECLMEKEKYFGNV